MLVSGLVVKIWFYTKFVHCAVCNIATEEKRAALDNLALDDFAERVRSSRRKTQLCGSCAVVLSSGFVLQSRWGESIDGQECVMRFNDAPAGGEYAGDVGTRTTYRHLGIDGTHQLVRRATRGSGGNTSWRPERGFLLKKNCCGVRAKLRAQFPRSPATEYGNGSVHLFASALDQLATRSGLKLPRNFRPTTG